MGSWERVHIFGAAGCGSSTLGRALAQRLEYQHVDADDVYWLVTVPPYQTRRAAAERVRMLEDASRWARHWVLSGSIVGWGDAFHPVFTGCLRHCLVDRAHTTCGMAPFWSCFHLHGIISLLWFVTFLTANRIHSPKKWSSHSPCQRVPSQTRFLLAK